MGGCVAGVPERWHGWFSAGQVTIGAPYLAISEGGQGWRMPVVDAPVRRCDSGQVARRQASVLVQSRDMPTDLRWLAADVTAGVTLQDGTGSVDVAQIVGRLRVPPQDDDRGLVLLDIASPELALHGHGFTQARTIAGGALGTLANLVWESLPGHAIAVDDRVRDVPLMVADYGPGDDARWEALTKIAAAASAEFGSDRGGRLRVADAVEPWPPGQPPIKVEEGVSTGRLPIAESDITPNVVRVVAPDTPSGDDEPPYGVAVDDRPYSPAYVGPHISPGRGVLTDDQLHALPGYAPLVTRTFELPVTSWLDASSAARGLVVRKSRAGDVTLSMPCNPWLDWGDLIHGLGGPDRPAEAYIVTGFEIPILLPPVMQVTARLA